MTTMNIETIETALNMFHQISLTEQQAAFIDFLLCNYVRGWMWTHGR